MATLPAQARALLGSAQRRETRCGSGTIAWQLWGAGPPVVLLHGGSGSWAHWLRNIPALVEAGHLVCVPDLPGFGASARPPGGDDADAVVEPLIAGLRELLPASAFDLVGFSFGSLVAALLAAQGAAQVRRLVLLGAPVLPLGTSRGVALRSWRHLPTQELQDEAHRQNLAAIMLHRPASIDHTALAIHAANVPNDRMPRRKLVTTDAMARALDQVTCPIWALYGREDAVLRHTWSQVEAAWRRVPQLRELTTVPDSGHWVQFEEPGTVNAWLARVLRS